MVPPGHLVFQGALAIFLESRLPEINSNPQATDLVAQHDCQAVPCGNQHQECLPLPFFMKKVWKKANVLDRWSHEIECCIYNKIKKNISLSMKQFKRYLATSLPFQSLYNFVTSRFLNIYSHTKPTLFHTIFSLSLSFSQSWRFTRH